MTPGFLRTLAAGAVLAVTAALAIVWLRRRFTRSCGLRVTWALALVGASFIVAFVVLSIRIHSAESGVWTLAAFEVASVFAGTMLVCVWSVLTFELVLAGPSLVRRLARRPATPPDPLDVSRREAIARVGSGVIAVAAAGTVSWGALRTRLDIEVVEVAIRLPRLPRALDGFTIAQISDIHIGPFFGERPLRHVEDAVRRLKPDLVAMTGDLIDVQPTWIPAGATFLSRLIPLARHGVVAIPGNHEHYAGVALVLDALRRAGVDVLFNAGRLIGPGDGGGFALVGVDDVSSYEHGLGPGPLVGPALATLPADRARILLCHQPSYLPTAAAHGFDLMLSGHTHGGQIAPIGPVVVKALYGNYAGLGQLGDTRIYVNRGLGTSGPPVRLAIRPEITKIVLVAA